MALDLTAADLAAFTHDFALATIDGVQKYDRLMSSLESGPPSADAEVEMRQVRLAAVQGAVALATLSVTLTELDLGRVADLDPLDDVRVVQPLLQAVADSLVVLSSEPTRETVLKAVLLSQETLKRLLGEAVVKACLDAHFKRATGRELGDFPDWQADLLAGDAAGE